MSGFGNEDDILNKVFHDSQRSDLEPASLRQGLKLGSMTFGTLLDDGFKTPSGKIEIYSDWFAEKGYSPLPMAEDGCDCDDRYPYRLITGARVDAFDHSQHRNIESLRKLCPQPEAEIPAEIATHLSIATGDVIAVETK